RGGETAVWCGSRFARHYREGDAEQGDLHAADAGYRRLVVPLSAVASEADDYCRALGLRGMKRNQFLAAVSAAQLGLGQSVPERAGPARGSGAGGSGLSALVISRTARSGPLA